MTWQATELRLPQEVVPQVRVLDALPAPESFVAPFSLLHMLHVLFQDISKASSGALEA